MGNNSIETRDLWENCVHVLKSGKTKLAENCIYFLNNCYWLSPCDNFLKTHTEKYWTYILWIIKRKEPQSILNTNKSNEVNNENIVLKILKLNNSEKVINARININSLKTSLSFSLKWFRRFANDFRDTTQFFVPRHPILHKILLKTKNHTNLTEIAKEEV